MILKRFNVNQIIDILGIAKKTLYNADYEKKIVGGYKEGRVKFYPSESVKAYVMKYYPHKWNNVLEYCRNYPNDMLTNVD